VDRKEDVMTLKTTLLAALGALFITAPAAVQAQPGDSDSYYYHHRIHHERRGCYLGRRYEYGLFGHYRPRTTLICR
jgi:hypothetical protein